PHPGEFARLSGSLPKRDERVQAAAAFAKALVDGGCAENVMVLKGHETVVTDGKRFSINRTGNPGMATGGTGDVLTGIITALLCQGMSPFDAARLGVHVHGLAGDLAANDLGQVSMIASDLIEYLPRAFRAEDIRSNHLQSSIPVPGHLPPSRRRGRARVRQAGPHRTATCPGTTAR